MILISKIKNQKSKIGFTLIELLVVISIIGILATLLIARYGMAEKSARDTQRKSDLNQYRIALENYALTNDGKYTTLPAGTAFADTLCTDGDKPLAVFMATCPKDPLNPTNNNTLRSYYYRSINGSQYVMFVVGGLEQQGQTWVVCSNGRVGLATNNLNDIFDFCSSEG